MRLPLRSPVRLSRDHVAVAAASLAGALLLSWVTTWALVGDGVPRGTTVLGVDIGGMSRAEAAAHLREELAGTQRQPITVTAVGQRLQTTPKKAGLSLDAMQTVSQASDRPVSPVALLGMLFGDQRVEPVVAVDRPEIRGALDRLAKKVDKHPRDGQIRFADGEAVTVKPRAGQVVDVERSVPVLRDAYLRRDEVRLPTRQLTPTVTSAELERAMRDFARPAMSGPVVLEVTGEAGPGQIEVSPTDLDDYLSMAPDRKGRLGPKIDGRALRKALSSRLADYETEPEDASFRVRGGEPRIIPATTGQEVGPRRLAAAVLSGLRADDRTARLPLERSQPELTTAEAESLGINERVSRFTTAYPYAAYRLQNIHRAADLADETLLRPGETFSLNEQVGERTAENGFARGTIIQDGRFFEDFGGGVSQLATTMFNAAFFAGLEDVEHEPHSFYISRYPEGREATVVWGALDMAFRNDSGHGILVDTSYTDSTVTVTLYGTKVYDIKASKSGRSDIEPFDTIYDDSPKCLEQEGVKGFDVDVYREFYRGGQRVRTETLKTDYVPADQVYCRPKPKPTTESKPTTDAGNGGTR